MKKLKLFPKTFFYTLTIMIFVIVIAHILIYLLAPQMGRSEERRVGKECL